MFQASGRSLLLLEPSHRRSKVLQSLWLNNDLKCALFCYVIVSARPWCPALVVTITSNNILPIRQLLLENTLHALSMGLTAKTFLYF